MISDILFWWASVAVLGILAFVFCEAINVHRGGTLATATVWRAVVLACLLWPIVLAFAIGVAVDNL